MQNETNLQNWEVTVWYVVNASRDIDLEVPELEQMEYIISADSESDAMCKSREMDHYGMSVWETCAFPIN